MENQNTQLMEMDNGFVGELTGRTTQFCSIVANTQKEKAVLYNVMNNPEKRIADCINMTINVKDIFAENVVCTNDSGESKECPRIVLVDDKGVGYQAVSLGLFGAIKKLIGSFGAPTWETPIPVDVKQITKGEKKLLTLEVNVSKMK